MTVSVRSVLKNNGVITLSHCSLKRLVRVRGASSLGAALDSLAEQPGIDLAPELGGQRISKDDLLPGDLIIVGGDPPAPLVAPGPIAYAILYLGGDEAAGAPLEVIDSAETVCVARPHIPPDMQKLRSAIQVGEETRWGKVTQAVFRLDSDTWCPGFTEQGREMCRNWVGNVNLGVKSEEDEFHSFYLPKFIADAYAGEGVPVAQPHTWQADLKPDEVVILLTGSLGYVGHLKSPD